MFFTTGKSLSFVSSKTTGQTNQLDLFLCTKIKLSISEAFDPQIAFGIIFLIRLHQGYNFWFKANKNNNGLLLNIVLMKNKSIMADWRSVALRLINTNFLETGNMIDC